MADEHTLDELLEDHRQEMSIALDSAVKRIETLVQHMEEYAEHHHQANIHARSVEIEMLKQRIADLEQKL